MFFHPVFFSVTTAAVAMSLLSSRRTSAETEPETKAAPAPPGEPVAAEEAELPAAEAMLKLEPNGYFGVQRDGYFLG